MRKAALIVALTLLTVAGANADVLKVRPANPSDGKLLTMDEAVFGRLRSQTPSFRFEGNTLTYKDMDGKVRVWDGGELYQKPARRWNAVSEGGSLWIESAAGRVCIAESEADGIVYGESVSRNEFGISGGIFVSPDSTRITFYRKDETRVTKFPLLDITSRTGTLRQIRYPMAGMDSELITLGIHDMASGKTVYLKVDDFSSERYLACVTWSPDSRHIFVQVINRCQDRMNLNVYDAATGEFEKTILSEEDERYVEPREARMAFLGEKLIYTTNVRDGYRNLYLVSMDGAVERLTKVDADVKYVANDGRYVYYTSSEVSPAENHLFRIDTKKKKKNVLRLTFEQGWHEIAMSSDCRSFVDRWSSFDFPGAADLCSTDGKTRERLSTSPDTTEGYAFTQMEFGTVKSADGKFDNFYRLYLPKDFDPAKKYPVIHYVYGGPHSQMVRDSWLGQIRWWEQVMAQKGYIVYVQDNRGTDNHGAEYEKVIHRRCGQCEMEDQIAGMKELMERPYVDQARIGVVGWSYGGFMTITLLTHHPEIYSVGVAGGPVIDWKWYEVMYGERYMDTPEENPEGFQQTSLIGMAPKLCRKLLICQGAIDNTVLWQNSLSFIRECVKNNVPVDYFPYPCAEHNVRGKDRIHLLEKITAYFEDYL